MPTDAKNWIKVRVPAAVVGGLISLAVSAATLWANQGHATEQAAKDAAEAKSTANKNAADIRQIQLDLAKLDPVIRSTAEDLKDIKSDLKSLRRNGG